MSLKFKVVNGKIINLSESKLPVRCASFYGSKRFEEIDRKNRLLNIVSSQNGTADIKIYQDINIYVSELEIDKSLEFEIKENRQVYFVQIEGTSNVNDITLDFGDAMEIVDIEKIEIKALENSHFLFIEMAKV